MNNFFLFLQRFFIFMFVTYSLYKITAPFIYAKEFLFPEDLLYWNVQVDIFQIAFCVLSLIWLFTIANAYKNWHWISFMGGFVCVVYIGWLGFLGGYIWIPLAIIFSIQVKMYLFFLNKSKQNI